MIRIAAVVSLLLAVMPALAEDDTLSSGVVIDSGRLGVMMEQSRALIPQIEAPPVPTQPETAEQRRAWIYDNLVSAVLEYNALSQRACRNGIVDREFCKGPFQPAWLTRPRDYSYARLRAMTDEASGRLMPFWAALCDKAPKPSDGGYVCPME
ncbi:MAG: hypothetical protein WDN08_08505 [Rhizomicrobium sp.]